MQRPEGNTTIDHVIRLLRYNAERADECGESGYAECMRKSADDIAAYQRAFSPDPEEDQMRFVIDLLT